MILKTVNLEKDCPEDYITFSTHNNYYEYEEDDERLVEVRKFLTEVLPKENIREYVMTVFGSFMMVKHMKNSSFLQVKVVMVNQNLLNF